MLINYCAQLTKAESGQIVADLVHHSTREELVAFDDRNLNTAMRASAAGKALLLERLLKSCSQEVRTQLLKMVDGERREPSTHTPALNGACLLK